MTFAEKKLILIAYLKMKTEDGDWHAVSDAANDLRELEARECKPGYDALKWALEERAGWREKQKAEINAELEKLKTERSSKKK